MAGFSNKPPRKVPPNSMDTKADILINFPSLFLTNFGKYFSNVGSSDGFTRYQSKYTLSGGIIFLEAAIIANNQNISLIENFITFIDMKVLTINNSEYYYVTMTHGYL